MKNDMMLDAKTISDDLKTLSRNIKYLRKMKGVSQETLAADIHITRTTYSAYETGVKTPDLQTLDALAAVYEIGFEGLMSPDLADSLLGRIYFDQDSEDLVGLLNNYQGLSIASKNLVAEDLRILLDRESVFYRSYDLKSALLEEQAHNDVDGDGNGDDGGDGTEE